MLPPRATLIDFCSGKFAFANYLLNGKDSMSLFSLSEHKLMARSSGIIISGATKKCEAIYFDISCCRCEVFQLFAEGN